MSSSARSAFAACVALVYGRRPSVSQIAARTSESSSSLHPRDERGDDRHRASTAAGALLARLASPALRGLTDRGGRLDAILRRGVAQARCDIGNQRRPLEAAQRAQTHARGQRVAAPARRLGGSPNRWQSARGDLRPGGCERRVADGICAVEPTRQRTQPRKDAECGAGSIQALRELAALMRCATLRTIAHHRRLPQVASRAGVLQHLRRQIERIGDVHVDDLAGVVPDSFESRHDEAGIRRQTETVDPGDHFVAQGRIEMDAVGFDERPCRRRSPLRP